MAHVIRSGLAQRGFDALRDLGDVPVCCAEVFQHAQMRAQLSVYAFAQGGEAGEGYEFAFDCAQVVAAKLVAEELRFDGVIDGGGEAENRAVGGGLAQSGEGLRAQLVIIRRADVGGGCAFGVADALVFARFQLFLQGGDAVERFGRADVGKLVRHGFGEFGHGQTIRQALRDGGVEFCRVARGNGGGDGQQGELFGFQAA